MRFEAKSYTDKNGNPFFLRNAELSDASDLIRYLKVVAEETPWMIREPEEVSLTEEQEREFLQGRIDAERELMLVAIVDGRIALYQEYCGRGIGKVMLETILEVARKLGYEQAELEVIAGNDQAIALYEKLGFRKYGTFPDNMKYKDGSYADAYWMMKKL